MSVFGYRTGKNVQLLLKVFAVLNCDKNKSSEKYSSYA